MEVSTDGLDVRSDRKFGAVGESKSGRLRTCETHMIVDDGLGYCSWEATGDKTLHARFMTDIIHEQL